MGVYFCSSCLCSVLKKKNVYSVIRLLNLAVSSEKSDVPTILLCFLHWLQIFSFFSTVFIGASCGGRIQIAGLLSSAAATVFFQCHVCGCGGPCILTLLLSSLFSPACFSAWIYFPGHPGGQINIYGECHGSWPGNRGQRSIFFPATLSLFCDWWRPRHRHRHQTSGLRDDHRLPAHRQRHGQHSHVIFAHAVTIVQMCVDC